jgi:hypothetical protein
MNNNITRIMAVLLFSGNISNWDQFGSTYPNLHTVLCMRHAGSGTHATLDYAVEQGNGWGGTLISAQNIPGQTRRQVSGTVNGSPATTWLAAYDGSQADVYFNDGTGDELDCINNYAGAIGYADADKATVSGTCTTKADPYHSGKTIWDSSSCTVGWTNIWKDSTHQEASVKEIAYQGEYPTPDGVMNGRYDFWTNEWAYISKKLTGDNLTAAGSLLSYVSGKIPAAELPFWVDDANIHFTKSADSVEPGF